MLGYLYESSIAYSSASSGDSSCLDMRCQTYMCPCCRFGCAVGRGGACRDCVVVLVSRGHEC